MLTGALYLALGLAQAQNLTFPESLPQRSFKVEYYTHNLASLYRNHSDWRRIDMTVWSFVVTCTRESMVDSCTIDDGILKYTVRDEGSTTTREAAVHVGEASLDLYWGKGGRYKGSDWKDLPKDFGESYSNTIITHRRNQGVYYKPDSLRQIADDGKLWLARLVAMSIEAHRPKTPMPSWKAPGLPQFGVRTSPDFHWGNPVRRATVQYTVSQQRDGEVELSVEGEVQETFERGSMTTSVAGALWIDASGDVVSMTRTGVSDLADIGRLNLELLVRRKQDGHTAAPFQIEGHPSLQ